MGEGDMSHRGGRICANCSTSKTPLWRNGPDGAKNLCNACGIRFKKLNRLLAAGGPPAKEPTTPRKPNHGAAPPKRKSFTGFEDGQPPRQRRASDSELYVTHKPSALYMDASPMDVTHSGSESADSTPRAAASPSQCIRTPATLKSKWKAFAKVYHGESLAIVRAMNSSASLNTAVHMIYGIEA